MAGQLDARMMKLAFVFVLVGYGTKAGLAPMRTWLPQTRTAKHPRLQCHALRRLAESRPLMPCCGSTF